MDEAELNELVEAMESRRRSDELLTAALDLTDDGVFIVDLATMRCIDVNEGASAILGRSRDVLLRQVPAAILERIAADGEVIGLPSGKIRATELSLVRPDGSTVECELRCKQILHEARRFTIAALRDVTDRNNVQERVVRFATAMELSGDAVFMVDRDSMSYVDVNEACCRLMGYSRQEILKLRPGDFGNGRAKLMADYDKVILQAPHTVTIEAQLRRRDGSWMPCEVRRQAFPSGSGWMIVSNCRDITERKNAETQLRGHVVELQRSNADLEKFAYVASHDLSEPLRMMVSYCQLLQRRYASRLDEDGREFIGFIVAGGQRMKALVDDLLLYSRSGRTAELLPIDLDRVLDDALANLRDAIGRTGAVIQRDPLPRILGDRTGLLQIFQNLLGNAMKFQVAGKGVEIAIGCTDMGREWVVTVRDNGIGIDPQYFQRIFIIFQRLHARDRYEGTGIGLAICKKVVERHGGRIELTSTPGQGATFILHLPKLEHAAKGGRGEDGPVTPP